LDLFFHLWSKLFVLLYFWKCERIANGVINQRIFSIKNSLSMNVKMIKHRLLQWPRLALFRMTHFRRDFWVSLIHQNVVINQLLMDCKCGINTNQYSEKRRKFKSIDCLSWWFLTFHKSRTSSLMEICQFSTHRLSFVSTAVNSRSELRGAVFGSRARSELWVIWEEDAEWQFEQMKRYKVIFFDEFHLTCRNSRYPNDKILSPRCWAKDWKNEIL
jgi:hypothetical protein